MSLFDWLRKPILTVKIGGVMTFKEFLDKYRSTINPATSKAWTTGEMLSNSGLPEKTVNEYVDFWQTVQKTVVATQNRIPTNAEIVAAHDGPSEPTAQPAPVVEVRDPAKCIRTPFGLYRPPVKPATERKLADLTVQEFLDLMSQILGAQ